MLATEPLTSSLYSGFTGIAWAAETTDRLLGTDGKEDRNGDIDEALTSLLRRYPEHAPYDLIHGLAGIGVYALARWPRPGATQCILGVLEQLAGRARYDRDGVYWWTPPSWLGARQDYYRPGGIDLGVAHGVAGVIPFLAPSGFARAGHADRPSIARRGRQLAAGPPGGHRGRTYRP